MILQVCLNRRESFRILTICAQQDKWRNDSVMPIELANACNVVQFDTRLDLLNTDWFYVMLCPSAWSLHVLPGFLQLPNM